MRGLGGAHRTLLARGRLQAPVCTCVQPARPPRLPAAPFPTQAWPGWPGAQSGRDRPVHVPLQAQLTLRATRAPPPRRWGSFPLQCGLRHSWLGCKVQPRWHSPCAPGWPSPCWSRPLTRQAPPPATPSPLPGGPSGSAARSGSSDEGRLGGPQLGPPISQDWLGPCGAPASPGVERRHTAAGGEWTWSPGAAQGPLARSSLTRASLFARLWPLLAPLPTRLLPACLLPAQPDSARGASSLSSGLQSPNRVWASLGLQG